MRLLFIPFSMVAGLIAGALGRFMFTRIWNLIDDQEAPEPSHLETSWPKVLGAAALEGIIFATVRAATDRGARTGFMRMTGRWPGEEKRDETT